MEEKVSSVEEMEARKLPVEFAWTDEQVLEMRKRFDEFWERVNAPHRHSDYLPLYMWDQEPDN